MHSGLLLNFAGPRGGSKRFEVHVLLIILAAALSRAINGSAAFFPTLGGGVVSKNKLTLMAYDL